MVCLGNMCMDTLHKLETMMMMITVARDKQISKNYFKYKILNYEINNKSWLCKQHEDTIHHLILGCRILAKNECFVRHERSDVHLHYSKCKEVGIETTEKLYPSTDTGM